MRMLRAAAYLGLLVIALTAFRRTDARKEFVWLQVSSSSGTPVHLRVSTRGLIVIAPLPSRGRFPVHDTTLSTPVDLTLAGIGEADLEIVDSPAKLVVDVKQVRPNAPPAQRLTGKAFRVSRVSYLELYQVTASK